MENALKNNHITRNYNEHSLEFDRWHCGNKDGRVWGDVQVSEFRD